MVKLHHQNQFQKKFPFQKKPLLKLQSNLFVVGPSQCGKSTFVSRLLKCKFDQRPKHIWFCYGEIAPSNLPKNVKLIKGLPDQEKIPRQSIIILDDLMDEAGETTNIFTRIAHHRNVLVVFLTQNLFITKK